MDFRLFLCLIICNVLFYFHKNFSQAILCNILEVMCKDNFEQPFDTLNQIFEANLTLLTWPGSKGWDVFLSKSWNPNLRKIAETMIIPKSWSEYFHLMHNGILRDGTHFELSTSQSWHKNIKGHEDYANDERFTYLSEHNHGRGFYK